MFVGAGTVINVVAVLLGSIAGMLLGSRFPERTRELLTQVLGLFTLTLGASAIADGLFSEAFAAEVGASAIWLIVLGALLLGGIIGSLIKVEERFDSGAELLRSKFAKGTASARFTDGMVTATLVFCVGPLSILGSISDGLGHGIEQLVVKSIMDGFAAMAFASSMGIGVAFSIIPLALYQGALTLLGMGAGEFLSMGQIDSLGATGGVILIGLGIRLAGIKQIPVGDLLPALLIAPILTWIVGGLF